MGTRGLHKVIKDGKVVVAQYSQWDNYIEGQGVEALNFFREIVKDEDSKNKFRDNLDRVYEVQADNEVEEYVRIFGDGGQADSENWSYARTCTTLNTMFPSLSRDTGAQIYHHILNLGEGDALPVVLDVVFEKDTLFCEGVSCIDTDNWKFSWVAPGYNAPTYSLDITDKIIPSNDEFLKVWYELVGEE